MDNRRLFLAILLSLAVVVTWQLLFPPEIPKKPASAEARPAAAGGPARPGTGAAGPAGSALPAGGPEGRSEAAAGPPAAPSRVVGPGTPQIEAAQEERVVLTGGVRRAVFTNRGAQLLSLTIPESGSRTEVVELVRARRAGGLYPYALAGRDLRPLAVDGALFKVERAADGSGVTFRYSGPAGSVEKRFSFDPHGFLRVDVEAGGRGWGVFLGPGIRNPTADELSSRYEQRDAVLKHASEVKTLNSQGASEVKTFAAQGLAWVGLEDTYFLAAAVPESGVSRVVFTPTLAQPEPGGAQFVPVPSELSGAQKDLNREYSLLFEPEGNRLSLVSYWGAKRIEELAALPYGLDETVQLGWFRPLVIPLLAGLHWIHDHVIGNYGWAIVLMTVLIKLLLLPLTHRSTVSMRKMQKLNPKMQAIRDRYRPKLKDKQGRPNLEMQRKMNEEVMALYRGEGVNPAGGCLPLVLQMPFFFAFYTLLKTSFDLHHAPWILWIHDLSAKDPYVVLPLIMGGTQFLQTLLTPQAGDPTQRRMFLLMPLFMLIFFLAAPSGLVLYWLTNNVLTIIQQGVYNRLWKNEE